MLEQFFYEHPIFRLDELVSWKGVQGTNKPQSVQNLIQHYIKSGRLLRIKRELYTVISPNATAENVLLDSYLKDMGRT